MSISQNSAISTLIILIFNLGVSAYSQSGYQIEGQINNYDGGTAYLAMMYGDSQYPIDSTSVYQGSFRFEGPFSLESGVYLVVLPPEKSFFILIGDHENAVSFQGDFNDVEGSLVFQGSEESQLYYEYLRFVQEQKVELERIKLQYEAQEKDSDKMSILTEMQNLKSQVSSFEKSLVAKAPNSLTALMIRSEFPVEVPEFSGSPDEIQARKYRYYKKHFFDHIDLTDERLVRTPRKILVDKVDSYLDKLTMQQPDSIIASVDFLLSRFQSAPASFRFYLTYIFNKYREAKSVGMDAIYVHIAKEYIGKGQAEWINQKQIDEILAAVEAIEPTLIGKRAPNFTVQKRDGSDIDLGDIDSEFTVLFFWAPNCSHCQASMSTLQEFQERLREKGVSVFAVCTKVNESEKNCWEYIDAAGLTTWINASDQTGGNSSIHVLYNIKNTPSVFVLDRNKKILVKNIGVDQLEEVFKRILPEK